ncbi:DM13 domain-containing protein [Bacillus carboniphilus]|uniref:DM13 domain-containing protein n=1 Tax=Bacillus carboniphilus TaxID=86663 RepID=A0ABY9JW66_9BACI|nr:DM13 domain-containing protein [Bacillus carboniphilus]WLR42748.1 DM13 domain-containing protein [Bacillus carboniphilus]
MKKKSLFYLSTALIIMLLAAWAIFRPERAFLDREVDEEFPISETAQEEESNESTDRNQTEKNEEDHQQEKEDEQLYSGEFHDGSKKAEGTATIHQLASGEKILRLTDFSTSDGPDVFVYLVATEDVTSDDQIKDDNFINLGKLKGNKGNQNYQIPDDIDLTKYQSVSIWCKRFSVSFGAAPLKEI